MFKINRNTIVIGSMVILLLVTGFLNYQFTKNKTNTNNQSQLEQTQNSEDATTTGNFFTDFRAERTQNRQQEITYLDSVINNTNTDKETMTEAQKMKLDMTGIIEKETVVEGLLKAKGFADVAVTISPEAVNVVVKDAELTQAKVAQILEVVQRETTKKAENIKVIPTT